MNTFGYTVKTDHCPLLDCLSKVTQLTESSLLHGQHCNYSQAHSQTQQPSTAPAGAWGWSISSIQKLLQITGLHGHTSKRRQSCAQNGYECMAMNGSLWPSPTAADLTQLDFFNFHVFQLRMQAAKLQSCKAAKLQSQLPFRTVLPPLLPFWSLHCKSKALEVEWHNPGISS